MSTYIHFSNFPKKIITSLLVLLPIFLITGPFLSDLAVTTVSIITLLHIIKNKDFRIFDNIFFKIFLVFWLNSCAISFYQYFNANYTLEKNSLTSSLFYIRFIFFYFANYKILKEKKEF